MIDFKEFAKVMLDGWCAANNDPEQSLESHYNRILHNENDAEIMSLAGHWADDLLSLFGTSSHIRLCMEVIDGKWTVQNVPPPPGDNFYWSHGSFIFQTTSDATDLYSRGLNPELWDDSKLCYLEKEWERG